MRCPFCGNDETQVKDSRPADDGAAIRRRRFCAACANRFTTFERTQLRDLTYVDDVTQAFIGAAESPACHGGIFNIGGPPPISLHDLAEMVVRLAGPSAHYTTREFPADRAQIDIGSYHADDSAFRKAAGWEPKTGLEDGIARTIDWYRTRLGDYL